MSKLLRGKPITQNLVASLIWQVIVWGVGLLIGAYTTHVSRANGVPMHTAIINGVLVFFALALGALAIATIVRWFQKPRQEEDTTSEKTAAPVVTECRDRWLHDIAEEQRQALNRYVWVTGCRINRHELLRDDPYIEFHIHIHNESVYNVDIGDRLGGSISFEHRLLSGELRWSENPPKDMPFGRRDVLVVRQSLTKADVAHVLNASRGSFYFRNLDITVTGGPAFRDEVTPQRLSADDSTSNEELLAACPKLKMEFRLGTFTGYNDLRGLVVRGLLVNVHVNLINQRRHPVDIRAFKVTVRVNDRTYIQRAEVGNLHEWRRIGEDGEEMFWGRNLNNLSPSDGRTLRVERDLPHEGWLQFVIKDVGNEEQPELSATLTAIDPFGEEHSEGCTLVYVTP